MFSEVAFALTRTATSTDYSDMKPALAHLSPTVPATLAAGIGIALSIFLLPGIGGQGEPTSLLPAIGGAAGRVAADLPAPANERASEPVAKASVSSPAQFDAARTEHFVPQRRQAAAKAHRVHRRARPHVVRRAPSAPVQVAAAPAAPATPATERTFFSTPATAKGKAHGHEHSHGHGHGRTPQPTAGAPAPGSHGHGRALGRSSEHHDGLPPGHAKKAPTAPAPAPTSSQKATGDGNGHKGGKK
jgi:hypothetical protein